MSFCSRDALVASGAFCSYGYLICKCWRRRRLQDAAEIPGFTTSRCRKIYAHNLHNTFCAAVNAFPSAPHMLHEEQNFSHCAGASSVSSSASFFFRVGSLMAKMRTFAMTNTTIAEMKVTFKLRS